MQTSDISKAQKSYSAIISKSYFVSEEVDENTKYNVYINIVKPKKLTADEIYGEKLEESLKKKGNPDANEDKYNNKNGDI